MESVARATGRADQELRDELVGVAQAGPDASLYLTDQIAEIRSELAREREALRIEADRIHEHRMSMLLGRIAGVLVVTEQPPPGADAAPNDIPSTSTDCEQAIRTFVEEWGSTAVLNSDDFAQWMQFALVELGTALCASPEDALSKAVRRFDQMPEILRANALEMMLNVETIEDVGGTGTSTSGATIIKQEWDLIGLDLFPPSQHSRVREMLEGEGITIS